MNAARRSFFLLVLLGACRPESHAPSRRPVEPPVESPNGIPDAPLNGTVHGTPFTVRDARYVVDRRIGYAHTDILLSSAKADTPCGPLAYPCDERLVATRGGRSGRAEGLAARCSGRRSLVGPLPGIRRQSLGRRRRRRRAPLDSRGDVGRPSDRRAGGVLLRRPAELRVGVVRRAELSSDPRPARPRRRRTRGNSAAVPAGHATRERATRRRALNGLTGSSGSRSPGSRACS